MLRGRILVVSDRSEVIAELDPLVRAEGHLMLSVPNEEEALRALEEGSIPDILISDVRSPGSATGECVRHFRRLNQIGKHFVLMDEEDSSVANEFEQHDEPYGTLSRPFDAGATRHSIQAAMEQVRTDLESLRGEVFRETARLQKAMRDAQLEMVTALALTMEAKDPYMHGHCDRVSHLACEIASEMRVGAEETELLRIAAILHEIGKLGVSMELLHKEGPLTPAELALVRGHALVGAQIVGAVHSLRPMAPIIQNQYTDYVELPMHLSPETPEFLLASILRVADTYDAMTSNRSYRRTLSRERWMPIIVEGTGSQFHPEVVDAFLRIERRRSET